MPDIQDPDNSESGDEIRLEHSTHDGDCFDLVYKHRIPVRRTGPGSVEDV